MSLEQMFVAVILTHVIYGGMFLFTACRTRPLPSFSIAATAVLLWPLAVRHLMERK
jgi:hypothetical protein